MEDLKQKLKLQIIEALNLDEMSPDEIADDQPLFGEGLGLDSIDALELIVMLEKNYGIRIKDPAAGKQVFASVNAMTEFVAANKTK